MPEKRGERHFSRELPTPCMGPGGAAQACHTSKAALKFLEQGLVQRRIGNRLHRLFLLHWEVPVPGGGWVAGGPGLQHQACSVRPGLPHTVHPRRWHTGTQGWSAAWGPGVFKTPDLAWQTLEGREEGQQGESRLSVGLKESFPVWDSGTWVQMDSYETNRSLNTPKSLL